MCWLQSQKYIDLIREIDVHGIAPDLSFATSISIAPRQPDLRSPSPEFGLTPNTQQRYEGEAEGAGEEDEAGVEGAGGGVARGLLFA